MTKRRIFICSCHSLEHQLAVWYDKEECAIFVEPHLIAHEGFFKRLWIGLKYAFGYKSRFGHFDETILEGKELKRMMRFLNKVQ